MIEYNAWLVRLAAAVDTPDSRVVTTGLAQLDPYTETYDYVHPTAAGERKYADVISTALAAVGIGDGPRSDLMDLSAPFAWAPIPRVTARSGTLTATWDAVDYASAQDVHVVDMTATEADGGDHSVVARVKRTTYSLAVEPGHRYRVWLAPVKTNLPKGRAPRRSLCSLP